MSVARSSTSSSTRNAASANASILSEALEQVLRSQLAVHEKLIVCIERKNQAIRMADLTTITNISGEENQHIQQLAGMERARLDLVGRLTQLLASGAKQPLTISQIAEQIPEPQRSRLQVIAAQLREKLHELRRRSAIVRQAAETLNRHMAGIVQTVHTVMNKARVYGQRGRLAPGASLPSVVDMKL